MLTFYDVILSLEVYIFSEIGLLRNAYLFTRQKHKYLPNKMELFSVNLKVIIIYYVLERNLIATGISSINNT